MRTRLATKAGARWAWPLMLLIAMTVAAGCSQPEPEAVAAERVEQTRAELVESGASPEVADCVIRLARYDLSVRPLDDITRDELVTTCQRAQEVLDGDSGADGDREPDDLAFVDGPNTLGDDSALDRLWRLCEEGSGADCDRLFEQSPVGSEYEQFGVSCGNRDAVLRCSELDEETP